MGLFFEKDWDKYDPDKGDLYGFMGFRLKMRMKDLGRQDASESDSMDASVGGEDGILLGDTIPGDTDVGISGMMLDATVMELMTLMLSLKTRLEGKKANPTRINYYRLFFTDEIADIIQFSNSVEIKAFTRRERDLFRVLKESFLNFCMISPCSCVEDIWHNDWKLHGQIVKGKPMKPPKEKVNKKGELELNRFLPLDVYTTYMKQVENHPVGESAIDPHRKEYEKFMRDQLLC